MTLLIDGHNLIGAGVFRDIHLSDEDDEAKLVARLKVWRSRIRRKMIVFFDRGIAGGRDHRMSGAGVEVVFATSPTEADDLIRRRLRNGPRNTILVSNDDALAREAEVYGLERWRGHEFIARMALRMPEIAVPEAGEEWDIRLSKEEVAAWLKEFKAAHAAKRARRKAQADAARAARANGDGGNLSGKERSGSRRVGKTRPLGRMWPIDEDEDDDIDFAAMLGPEADAENEAMKKGDKVEKRRKKLGPDNSGRAGTAKPDARAKQSQRKLRKAARDSKRQGRK